MLMTSDCIPTPVRLLQRLVGVYCMLMTSDCTPSLTPIPMHAMNACIIDRSRCSRPIYVYDFPGQHIWSTYTCTRITYSRYQSTVADNQVFNLKLQNPQSDLKSQGF